MHDTIIFRFIWDVNSFFEKNRFLYNVQKKRIYLEKIAQNDKKFLRLIFCYIILYILFLLYFSKNKIEKSTWQKNKTVV